MAKAVEEITRCLEIAANLSIPCVRLKAADAEDTEAAIARVSGLIARMLPVAEQQGVTLVLETSGLFADTARLRDVLDSLPVTGWRLCGTGLPPTLAAARRRRRSSRTWAPTCATFTSATRRWWTVRWSIA